MFRFLIRFRSLTIPIRWWSWRPSQRWKRKSPLSQVQKVLPLPKVNPNWLSNVARRKKKTRKSNSLVRTAALRYGALVSSKLPDLGRGVFVYVIASHEVSPDSRIDQFLAWV